MSMSLLAAIILISLILCAIAIPFFIRSFDASIFIGQVKHLEFDLIRNQSH